MNQKPNIYNVISLGTMCHVATFLKKNNLRTGAYPYDWIFSNPGIIYDTLNDNFQKLLDKSYYVDLSKTFPGEKKCGHKKYGYCFFNHKNPIENEDYLYYKRCVERFNTSLQDKQNKLFIMMFRSSQTPLANDDLRVIHLINKKLTELTSNHYLLCINHIVIDTQKKYESTIEDNFIYVDFYATSKSSGTVFGNKEDNENFKQMIFDLYDFQFNKQ